MSLYEQIGQENICKIIRRFYDLAFSDPIIGHLFWQHDKENLISRQISFASSMLGAKEAYKGKPLKVAHANLKLNQAHFGRRQVLMKEVLTESGLEENIVEKWLDLEDRLKSLIVNNKENCRSN